MCHPIITTGVDVGLARGIAVILVRNGKSAFMQSRVNVNRTRMRVLVRPGANLRWRFTDGGTTQGDRVALRQWNTRQKGGWTPAQPRYIPAHLDVL